MTTNYQLASLLSEKTDEEMNKLRKKCNVDIMYDEVVNLMAKKIMNNKESNIKDLQIKAFFDVRPENVYYNQINKEVLKKVKVKLRANGFKVKIGTYSVYSETYLDIYVKKPNLLTKFIKAFQQRIHGTLVP